jgi:Ethanolamine utilization protein EutJ (predicted chaperonin)
VTGTDSVAETVADGLALAYVGATVDEPDEDMRSGGHFLTLTLAGGRRFTILVTEDER